METNLPGLWSCPFDWKDEKFKRNVLSVIVDGSEVTLVDKDYEPIAVIVPVEKYRELVEK